MTFSPFDSLEQIWPIGGRGLYRSFPVLCALLCAFAIGGCGDPGPESDSSLSTGAAPKPKPAARNLPVPDGRWGTHFPWRLPHAEMETASLAAMTQMLGAPAISPDELRDATQAGDPRIALQELKRRAHSRIEELVETNPTLVPVFVVINTLPWTRNGVVTLDVTDFLTEESFSNALVQNWFGQLEPSQLQRLPGPRYEITFTASQVPGCAWSVFSAVKNIPLTGKIPTTLETKTLSNGTRTLANDRVQFIHPVLKENPNLYDRRAERALLAEAGFSVTWTGVDGQPVELPPARNIQYHQRGAAQSGMRIVQESEGAVLTTALMLYDRLPWMDLHFKTETENPGGQIHVELPLAFTPTAQRGASWFSVSDATGGLALFFDERGETELEDSTLRLTLPLENGQAHAALAVHANDLTPADLERTALEAMTPMHVVPTTPHMGRYHPMVVRLEAIEGEVIQHPMLRVTPEEIFASPPRLLADGEIGLDLHELQGEPVKATIELVSGVESVNGIDIRTTSKFTVDLEANQVRTIRYKMKQ